MIRKNVSWWDDDDNKIMTPLTMCEISLFSIGYIITMTS